MYGRVWFLALIPIPKTRLDPPIQSHLSYPGLLMKQLLEIGASTHQNLAKVMESFAFRSCESLSQRATLVATREGQWPQPALTPNGVRGNGKQFGERSNPLLEEK